MKSLLSLQELYWNGQVGHKIKLENNIKLDFDEGDQMLMKGLHRDSFFMAVVIFRFTNKKETLTNVQ
jgi:hypothetical protein